LHDAASDEGKEEPWRRSSLRFDIRLRALPATPLGSSINENGRPALLPGGRFLENVKD